MTRYACPICGDPGAFPIWVDKEPPTGCPADLSWHDGSSPKVTNVTECRYQMGKARQRAEWMRLVPDAFDEAGKMKPGELARVLDAYASAHPDKAIIL